jgi:hypothetical protein
LVYPSRRLATDPRLRASRSTEFGFPLGRFAGYWTEVKALFGSGVAKKQERILVHAVTASYVAFRKAELKGSEEAITETTEAPMRAKVLRDLKLRPRSARVAGGTWEIVKHVQKPSLQSVFRIPVLEKMTCSHCLVRFNTTQVGLNPTSPPSPPGLAADALSLTPLASPPFSPAANHVAAQRVRARRGAVRQAVDARRECPL